MSRPIYRGIEYDKQKRIQYEQQMQQPQQFNKLDIIRKQIQKENRLKEAQYHIATR